MGASSGSPSRYEICRRSADIHGRGPLALLQGEPEISFVQKWSNGLRNPMQPLQPSTTVVASREGFIEADVDGEILALGIEHGTCYGLNRVGSRIWNLLAEPT